MNNKSDPGSARPTVLIDNGDGEIAKASMSNGVPYFRKAGVEHDVINGNDFECAFIKVEIPERE